MDGKSLGTIEKDILGGCDSIGSVSLSLKGPEQKIPQLLQTLTAGDRENMV